MVGSLVLNQQCVYLARSIATIAKTTTASAPSSATIAITVSMYVKVHHLLPKSSLITAGEEVCPLLQSISQLLYSRTFSEKGNSIQIQSGS